MINFEYLIGGIILSLFVVTMFYASVTGNRKMAETLLALIILSGVILLLIVGIYFILIGLGF